MFRYLCVYILFPTRRSSSTCWELLLSILAGHNRYSHITALRCDGVSLDVLKMNKIISEDALRRGLGRIESTASEVWLKAHIMRSLSHRAEHAMIPSYWNSKHAISVFVQAAPGKRYTEVVATPVSTRRLATSGIQRSRLECGRRYHQTQWLGPRTSCRDIAVRHHHQHQRGAFSIVALSRAVRHNWQF